MAIECAYSFKDLFVAAFGADPEEAVLEDLYRLTQDERNVVVASWAKKAGWETKQRIGSDGKQYYAFCPSFKDEYAL